MESKLKIAIQKSGRLFEDSMRILKEAGIEFNNGVNKLKSEAVNFPLEVFFFRDDDIPQYVEDGIAEVGIVGENVVIEKNRDVKMIDRLGFAKCRLSIAIPKDYPYKSTQDFQGKRIATSYPRSLSIFLKKNDICAEIHEISGSVEIAPGIGLADAICDLVGSGSTLLMNGLKETEVILQSEAVLIGNKALDQTKLSILEKLRFRIDAVKKSKNNKYILLNAPNKKLDEICRIIPGMKSPTILPLAQAGWSSVHSVVNENDFWGILEKLKEYGAQGILVIPIEKMIL
ncbi:MAG: ATP phosphoribosyltransferase [Bacteroidales bacterium]|jgi:ATP phosphoribosyltransferase|nr:ATP phosphoribosyltransferase [Bacteroidales bacterium]